MALLKLNEICHHSPPDAFYGIFYVQNPFAAGAPPRTPLGGAYSAPPDPLAGGEGLAAGLALGPSGLKLSPPNPKTKLRP